ncbi:MAG: leucyl/phenylalanyl-tRNA--protein transferase [Desulfobulbaceae bacterium]|jgi:leucyl/phenylalanyl-tRNA--protein transferase|nr:leucyl/phenylalanyl-tRNA--protein transferase [Desulfobulbaceae bacterium]
MPFIHRHSRNSKRGDNSLLILDQHPLFRNAMPIYRLSRTISFPPPELAEADGLLAIGGDLRPERLVAAYRQGIFPWYSQGGPILWWFISPRLVLYPEELHISRRLGRVLRHTPFQVRFDTAFAEVIGQCATTRRASGQGTWITAAMRLAYGEMRRLGYAHSVECWQGDHLVGGLYGLRLDRVFFGESMFSLVDDASKIAFAALVARAKALGIRLIDCQTTTAHLLRFGAREIDGALFAAHLREWVAHTNPDGAWNDGDKEPS